MAVTKISDVVVPEVYGPYVLQRSVELCNFIKSGIATSDGDRIAQRLAAGGQTVNLPMWVNSRTSDEVPTEDAEATINKITADKDIAVRHIRNISYGASDYTRLLSGDDPMKAIAEKNSLDWANAFQDVAVSSLKGIFDKTAGALKDNTLDISGGTGAAAVVSYDALVDALYLLGDHAENVKAIAMHSAVFAALTKLKLLDNPSPVGEAFPFKTFLGRTIIVDDALEPTSGAYPIYLFGQGAFAFNELPGLAEIEIDRNKKSGNDYLITRRTFTMHPRGVKWVGTAAGLAPKNEELATAANWKLVDDKKNVAIAMLVAKVKQ